MLFPLLLKQTQDALHPAHRTALERLGAFGMSVRQSESKNRFYSEPQCAARSQCVGHLRIHVAAGGTYMRHIETIHQGVYRT